MSKLKILIMFMILLLCLSYSVQCNTEHEYKIKWAEDKIVVLESKQLKDDTIIEYLDTNGDKEIDSMRIFLVFSTEYAATYIKQLPEDVLGQGHLFYLSGMFSGYSYLMAPQGYEIDHNYFMPLQIFFDTEKNYYIFLVIYKLKSEDYYAAKAIK